MDKAIHKGEDYTGKKIGAYTVLGRGEDARYPSQKWGTIRWNVRCDCGVEKLIPKAHLVQGRVTGCGSCLGKRVHGSLHKNFTEGVKAVTGMYFGKIKAAAKRRNIEFKVDRKQLDKLFEEQEGKCSYTGNEIHFGQNGVTPTASLDRIDSQKPYEEGNLQWVHKTVNILKGTQTHEEFIKFCKDVTEHERKKQND